SSIVTKQKRSVKVDQGNSRRISVPRPNGLLRTTIQDHAILRATGVLFVDRESLCLPCAEENTHARRRKHVGRRTGLYLPLSVCFRVEHRAARTTAVPGDMRRRGGSSLLLQRTTDPTTTNSGPVARAGTRCPVAVSHPARSPATDLACRRSRRYR